MDWVHLPLTLEGYGAGPHMCKILVVFWDQYDFATCQKVYHIPHFKKISGDNQGGLISITLFNLIMDIVVRNWLALTVEEKLVAQEGLVLAVGRCLGIFYTDDGIVVSRVLECIQVSLNIVICLFCWYGLVANVVKSNTMTCHPGALRSGVSEDAVGRQCTGIGAKYQERLR